MISKFWWRYYHHGCLLQLAEENEDELRHIQEEDADCRTWKVGLHKSTETLGFIIVVV